MFLFISAALFIVFSVNVAMGAFYSAAFLGDIGEMLLLFATATCFVIAILQLEAKAKQSTTHD